MRNLHGGPFIRLVRPGRTQQRITFDVDWAGRYLTTGGTVRRRRLKWTSSPMKLTLVINVRMGLSGCTISVPVGLQIAYRKFKHIKVGQLSPYQRLLR
jgi:hypothetical protein